MLALPLAESSFDALLDRGCFHYFPPGRRLEYEQEARRVLRPDGRFLLRVCLKSGGVPNGFPEEIVGDVFADWEIDELARRLIPADEREMDALVVRLRARL